MGEHAHHFITVVVVLTVWGGACLWIGYTVACRDAQWWRRRAEELEEYIRQLGGRRD